MTHFRWLCALAVLALGVALFTLAQAETGTTELGEQKQKQRLHPGQGRGPRPPHRDGGPRPGVQPAGEVHREATPRRGRPGAHRPDPRADGRPDPGPGAGRQGQGRSRNSELTRAQGQHEQIVLGPGAARQVRRGPRGRAGGRQARQDGPRRGGAHPDDQPDPRRAHPRPRPPEVPLPVPPAGPADHRRAGLPQERLRDPGRAGQPARPAAARRGQGPRRQVRQAGRRGQDLRRVRRADALPPRRRRARGLRQGRSAHLGILGQPGRAGLRRCTPGRNASRRCARRGRVWRRRSPNRRSCAGHGRPDQDRGRRDQPGRPRRRGQPRRRPQG